MTTNELHVAVERLRTTLRGAEFRDPHARAEVEALVRDIERESGAASAQTHARLRTRIDDAARRFEVEHPAITAVLERIGTALAAMGI